MRNPLRRGLLSQPVIQVCVALPPGCVQAAGGGNCMPVVLRDITLQKGIKMLVLEVN